MDANTAQQMDNLNQFNAARPTPSPGLQTTGYVAPYQPYNPNYQQRCPSCGTCPTCGRHQPYYQPYYQPWNGYPFVYTSGNIGQMTNGQLATANTIPVAQTTALNTLSEHNR